MSEFVDGEGKVEKENLTADDGQIGKELTDGAQAKDSVKDQVAGDFAQLGERKVVEFDAGQVGLLHEDNVQESFNYTTAFQLRQVFDKITYIHTRTNC